MDDKTSSYVNFFHEVGMLAKVPRSGFAFLGSGSQSVAEHSYRVTVIAYALANILKEKHPINLQKLMLMCLFHDLPEARTGDLNYVQKKYVQADENKALEELEAAYPFGPEIKLLAREYNEKDTLESQLAHDADQLEMLLVLKEQAELGNPQAMAWFDNSVLRLKTETAKLLAENIRTTPSHSWWLINPDDPHWITPSRKK